MVSPNWERWQRRITRFITESSRDLQLEKSVLDDARSQFGETHQVIKKFFPNAQLFGFTGTPILRRPTRATSALRATPRRSRPPQDLFQKSLHEYTITHAIEDRNVLRFQVDYYKADGKAPPKAWRDARQGGCRRCHPRQARRRHGWAQIQRHPRHGLDIRCDRVLRHLRKSPGREAEGQPAFVRSTSPRFSPHG